MSRKALASVGIACAAVLFTVPACTSSDTGVAEHPAKRRHSASPTPTRPSVRQAPELDDGETLAGRRKGTTGNAQIAFTKGRKGDALLVAVRCQGKGKIKVDVPSVGMSFPVECRADEAGTIYNEAAVTGASQAGTVSVEAPPSVHWSLTVGRGEPARADLNDAA
ncbi:hypothetical protein F7R91_05475 [Streptomyces luteolifulvus]|uniref:Lipoprotein n=1 Tax=Streptomyces luteolifulvus TaxID=2615112 RepID=A0A6H9V858_9ACTN|nr:hypothetical protein [Streptomyces luteolifulvus]KAB1149211.1 hypothetical protein F7R91_05475 [Streptomyces luteolifulvus]